MKTAETDIHYAAYLDGLPQPVITTDIHGIITDFNKAAGRLLEIQYGKALCMNISEFFMAKDSSYDIGQIILNQDFDKAFKGKYRVIKDSGIIDNVKISVSGVLNAEKEVAAVIVTIIEYSGHVCCLHQWEAITKKLAHMGDDYLENINQITALCSELQGAASAFYNRLDGGVLCSLATWNLPDGYKTADTPTGHICYDMIRLANNDIYCVRNLPETSYAISDPNVLLYGLKTYVGLMVSCNGDPIGSLCVVFQHDYECTEADSNFLRMLSLALEREETRESLRKSRNRYRELFDFAVEGILIGSSLGIITESNNSIQLMTGFQNDELVGRHITEVLFTAESLEKKPFRFDILKQDQVVVQERDILCKDKRVITVEMHSKMMPDHSYQSAMFDITARKEAERKLRLSENTYRGIINSLNDAIYILDKDGCFLDVNTASEKMYNYDKDYFIHKNPGFLSAPGKNDMNQTFSYIQDAYNGQPARFEFWGLRRDGSVFPKEVSLTPGFWFDEKVVIASGREMSERKQAEELLRISEEKYRLLVQYSSDPIFSFNCDETYRFVNDAFASQLGKKPEEIIGKTLHDIFPPEEAGIRLRLIQQVFHTGEKGETETSIVTVNHEENFYITLVDPIKDLQGNILWVTCIEKDITRRKKTEEELRFKNEQLKASNAEKDKFFSIVAHDLRGPMNGFLGLTSIMAEDIESMSSSEISEIATTMQVSAENIYRLIENLLEWSKMQRGNVNFEPQPMFLKSALAKSIDVVKDAANKKNIELRIHIPEHSVVLADMHMLETIIRNLLSNAIKFSYKDGIVEIFSSKTDHNMVRIEVRDKGIGMNPDLLGKLFLLTENTSRKGTFGEPSTGLGLILCKEFVEKHGGNIWAESVEGEGSSLIFTIPES